MTPDDRTYTSNLVAFCAALREHGVRVSTDDAASAARALEEIDPIDRDQFYYGLKACLVDEPSQVAVFDVLFEEYWDELAAEAFEEGSAEAGEATLDEHVAGDPEGTSEDVERADVDPPDSTGTTAQSSTDVGDLDDRSNRRSDEGASGRGDDGTEEVALEVGRQERSTTPTVAFEDDALATEELALLVTELGRQLGTLRGFRRRVRSSGQVDLRRALALAREKDPSDLPRVEKERSEAKVRFFVDVSHSMLRNMHQEFLLLFLFECVRQFADARVFMFDTDTAEVTTHFQAANVERTLEEMRRTRTEWGAGTTIGACLKEVLTADPFVVDNDTVCVVVSDGWDAGDLDRLREQMTELDRRCRRVLWFNPRAAADGYEPKVGGMETALPYVDHLFGFASVDDLRHLVSELRSRTAERD